MKAGILSDTHDHVASAEGALDLFLREKVEVIIHLGDVCTGPTLTRFGRCGIPLIGVFGNNDADQEGIRSAVGGDAFLPGSRLEEIDGRIVLMAHSFDALQEKIDGRGRFDLVLFGHTHRPLTMRMGRALVINPGEGCGLLTGRATCAVVDLADLTARILPVPPAGERPGSGLPEMGVHRFRR